MKMDLDYIYSFTNASVTLGVMDFLHRRQLPLKSVTVLNTIDRWIVKVKLKSPLAQSTKG